MVNFAKKTGDYISLSATDIKLMALTYRLEKEHVGTEHLKTEPQMKKTVDGTPNFKADADSFAGFYMSKKDVSSFLSYFPFNVIHQYRRYFSCFTARFGR